MAARIKDEVVIEDNRALRILRKDIFRNLPELQPFRRLAAANPTCCGDPSSEERQAIQKLKSSLPSFSADSLQKIKEALHTRALRVIYKQNDRVHEVLL